MAPPPYLVSLLEKEVGDQRIGRKLSRIATNDVFRKHGVNISPYGSMH